MISWTFIINVFTLFLSVITKFYKVVFFEFVMIIDYLVPKKEEFWDFLFINTVLAFLFSLSFVRFSNNDISLMNVFLMFFLFLGVLLFLRLVFMKFVAYHNGFEIFLRMTYFDRYWFRKYDRMSYTLDGKYYGIKAPVKANKGFAMPIVAVFLYVFSLGLIVFPCLWRYNVKTIPHRYVGTKQRYELNKGVSYVDVSNYRFAKVLFAGFIYYFVFAFVMKWLFSVFAWSFYSWFMFALYWIAFFSLVPIIGTEGYELFDKGLIGWVVAITVLILGMFALLVFESLGYVLFVTAISAVMILMVILWKWLM